MATSLKYTNDFLEQAHIGSYFHKDEILLSDLCGCFCCEQTFLPSEITEWIEENLGIGETAICPKCGIDSVLSSRFPIKDKEFLTAMNVMWF
ncbi:hypothetical protein D3C72_626820 [compost metagenome]